MNRFNRPNNDKSKFKFIYDIQKKRPAFKIIVNVVTIAVLITLATLISFYLRSLKIHESNIIMTYLLSVLLVSYLIEGYASGFIASILGVLTFNYFFTEPYYSLVAYRPDYPITFIFMFAAATITSTLTIKVKHEAKISFLREKRAYLLYHISQRLLHANKEAAIGNVIGEDVSEIMDILVSVALCNEDGNLSEPILYKNGNIAKNKLVLPSHQKSTMSDVAKKQLSLATEKQFYDDVSMLYVPVIGQNKSLGVIGFGLYDYEPLNTEKRELCAIIASLMAMAIERDRLNEEKRAVAIQIESEQLKGSLLRAISHDLRTPLTGILGATGTLIENGNTLSDEERSELLNNTYDETKWLIHTVENILSLTQLDEGKIRLNIKQEFMEEVIAEVISRTTKQLANHKVELSIPEDLIMIDMDGELIEHVLINLIDNASKYTPIGSLIKVIVTYQKDTVLIQVRDNGPGIPRKDIENLFNRFYTSGEISDRGRRGIGLGLEICKAIVGAHRGNIRAYNNDNGGATFEFTLPLRRLPNAL